MLAAYFMRYEGMSYEEARELLVTKRPLVNIQGRHQRALESWIQQYANSQSTEIDKKFVEQKQSN
jgi:protein-tyrosine phosphatase